jgi:adenylosuccinate synthase
MIKKIDLIVDLAYGDSGKGAITYQLSQNKYYNLVMRGNGSHNAGHTIYHNNKKFVTHIIPTGIFHNKKCYIGSECLLNVDKFFKEKKELEEFGIVTKNRIFISKDVHIVTNNHILEEQNEIKIGTTKQGVGPCARDKYQRTGIRAESVPELQEFIVDPYEFLYRNKNLNILYEGAQGFYLDISHGDYPYVTSSHTSVGGALLNGIPWNKIDQVFGAAKAYDTYVGSKTFQPSDDIFNQLQLLGQEFGATTGRPRQCNWLNLSNLIKAININGVTNVVISKLDILRELNAVNNDEYWCVIYNDKIISLNDEQSWKDYIHSEIMEHCSSYNNIIWRESPTDSVSFLKSI